MKERMLKALPEEGELEEVHDFEKIGFTTTEAIITYFNNMAGASVLTLPYALSQTGIFGLGVLLFFSIVMGTTSYLIGAGLSYVDDYAVQQKIPKLQRDWSLLGTVAFGEVGKKFVSVVFLLDLWGAIVRFLIVAGNNLSILSCGRIPAQVATIGTGIAAFFLMFVPVQYLARFSMLGILCQLSLFSCLMLTMVVTTISDPSSLAQDASLFPSDWHSMMTVFGCFVAVFHGQGSLPTLFQTIAEPERWGYVVGVGTGLCCLFYTSIGLVGYLTFGHLVQQTFTQNLGSDGNGKPVPYMAFAAPLSGGLVALKMIVSLPSFMRPIVLFVEGKFGMGTVTGILWKILFVAGSTSIAVYSLDLFAIITAIFGSLVHSIMAILIPFLCFLSVSWQDLHPGIFYGLFLMMVMSYGLTIPGTVADLQNIFGS